MHPPEMSSGVQLNDTGQSDNLDEPAASEAQQVTGCGRHRRRARGSRVSGCPDLLETWWERVLAIVAVGLIVWTIVDIVRYGR
jgi:hypothetical protein